jgi:NitT/TauT family transport system substrate-binding protein
MTSPVRIICFFIALLITGPAFAAGPEPLRLGLVGFGSGAWLVDVMRRYDLPAAQGLDLQTVTMANPAAGEVALGAGGVDAILSDWLWVARQRAGGRRLVFVPDSSAVGEILTPADSKILTLADLSGKRLGVAGGPSDKSWLLVRAYSRRVLGYDLADKLEPVYGAPPVLSQELAAGRIDAVLTFWPYAARLAAGGMRRVVGMDEVMRGLGFASPVPMMGFAFSEDWVSAHPGALAHFIAAKAEAERRLASDDGEWERLRPLTGAENDAVLAGLRDRYRAGILGEGAADVGPQAAALYTQLAVLGGSDSTSLPEGTFWTGGVKP